MIIGNMQSGGLKKEDKNEKSYFQYFIGYGNFEKIINKLSRNNKTKNKIKGQYLIKTSKLKLSEKMKKVEKYKNRVVSETDKNRIFKNVKKLLKYDNSTEKVIYDAFSVLEKILPNDEFLKYCYQYKYCLFKDIDGGKFTKKNGKIKSLENMEFLAKNELDVKNKYLNVISDFQYTVEAYIKLTKKNKEKNEKLLDFEIEPVEKEKNKIVYTLKHNIDEKLELTKGEEDLIQKAKNVLSLYAYIYEFEYFHPNIPLEYNNNPVLYYNYLIYYLYDLMVKREN